MLGSNCGPFWFQVPILGLLLADWNPWDFWSKAGASLTQVWSRSPVEIIETQVLKSMLGSFLVPRYFISNIDLFSHCHGLVAVQAGAGPQVLSFLWRVVFAHPNVPLLP